jgi:uncharacterized protein (TIGR03000 family)
VDGGNGQASARPATVVIKAATDVIVKFNGQETTRKKAEESFKTPQLQPGKTYSYDVVAEATRDGQKVTASKRILVRAGQTSEVDFADMSEAVSVKTETARITVLLPEGGQLYVDGKEFGSTAKQTFDTPKLDQGKTYYYTLEMRMKSANNDGAQKRRVTVEAGKEVTVDFRTVEISNR